VKDKRLLPLAVPVGHEDEPAGIVQVPTPCQACPSASGQPLNNAMCNYYSVTSPSKSSKGRPKDW